LTGINKAHIVTLHNGMDTIKKNELHEACPKCSVLLSTHRVTPDVYLNEYFASFFLLMILPPACFTYVFSPPFVNDLTYKKKLRCVHFVHLSIRITLRYVYLHFYIVTFLKYLDVAHCLLTQVKIFC
jgi:hypothetical protein